MLGQNLPTLGVGKRFLVFDGVPFTVSRHESIFNYELSIFNNNFIENIFIINFSTIALLRESVFAIDLPVIRSTKYYSHARATVLSLSNHTLHTFFESADSFPL